MKTSHGFMWIGIDQDEVSCFIIFNIDLDGGPCLTRRLSGCGAGVDYLAVSPGGDIYPCHQLSQARI